MIRVSLSCLALLISVHAQAEVPLGFAGCTDATFVSVDGQIRIATAGRSYSPKCLKVKLGATVTIDASSHHPLQGVGEDNPIFDEFGAAVSAKTVTFTKPGIFGYFCVAHGDDTGAGMAGVILVE